LTDPDPIGARGDAHRAVVLLRAAQPVREMGRGDHMVELGRRLVTLGGPGRAAVAADRGAAIVAVDHARGIAGVDPQRVVGPVGTAQRRERLAAVDRFEEGRVEDVYAVHVPRIGEHVGEVPGTLADLVVVARAGPGRAAVVRAEQAAGVRLHQRPHSVVVERRDGEPNLADNPLGEPLVAGDLAPAVATVSGFEDPAPGPTRDQLPGPPQRLPEPRVQDTWVDGTECQVDRPRAVVPAPDL